MLVPFGTHVVDRDGKSVGTVSRLISTRSRRRWWPSWSRRAS
jgi:ribosomal 30S subunit maturation factor RimM